MTRALPASAVDRPLALFVLSSDTVLGPPGMSRVSKQLLNCCYILNLALVWLNITGLKTSTSSTKLVSFPADDCATEKPWPLLLESQHESDANGL